jgi:hypothetical protein
MAERETNEGLDEFERQLSGLTIRQSSLDRAALLFQAGQETVQADRRRWRQRLRCWQAVAAAMTLLTFGLSWHAWQDQPQIVERIRYVPAPAVGVRVPDDVRDGASDDASLAVESQGRNRNHYLYQRYVALTVGLDGLGEHDWSDGGESSDPLDPFDNRTYRDLMNRFDEHQ